MITMIMTTMMTMTTRWSFAASEILCLSRNQVVIKSRKKAAFQEKCLFHKCVLFPKVQAKCNGLFISKGTRVALAHKQLRGTEEIWSLEDSESIDRLRPIYGLVFLFKYKIGMPQSCPIKWSGHSSARPNSPGLWVVGQSEVADRW